MIVKYSKKFPYAPYLNEDIGFEMEIGEDIVTNKPYVFAILATLKEMAEQFHKDNNPQLVEDTWKWDANYKFGQVEIDPNNRGIGQPTFSQPIPTVDYRAKEKLEIDIDNATTKADLEFYVDAAEKYGLMELWNEKNKSLNS